jgi:hypothetical protein
LDGKIVASYTGENWVVESMFLEEGGISVGKSERNGNMTYSPPSNKIQRCGVVRFHGKAVEVIVELLAITSQSGFCLHSLLD